MPYTGPVLAAAIVGALLFAGLAKVGHGVKKVAHKIECVVTRNCKS